MLRSLPLLSLHNYVIYDLNTRIIHLFTESDSLNKAMDTIIGLQTFLLSCFTVVIQICSIDVVVLWVLVTLRLKVEGHFIQSLIYNMHDLLSRRGGYSHFRKHAKPLSILLQQFFSTSCFKFYLFSSFRKYCLTTHPVPQVL
jgi:hypothetical protein